MEVRYINPYEDSRNMPNTERGGKREGKRKYKGGVTSSRYTVHIYGIYHWEIPLYY
jgi:hypothetical protein